MARGNTTQLIQFFCDVLDTLYRHVSHMYHTCITRVSIRGCPHLHDTWISVVVTSVLVVYSVRIDVRASAPYGYTCITMYR
jgi:hypothetical protein